MPHGEEMPALPWSTDELRHTNPPKMCASGASVEAGLLAHQAALDRLNSTVSPRGRHPRPGAAWVTACRYPTERSGNSSRSSSPGIKAR